MAFFTPNSKTSITIRTRQVSVFLCVFFLLEFNLAQAKSIPPNANIEEEETYYQKCKAFIKKHDVEKPFVRSIVCDHTLPAPSDEVRDKSRLIENVFYHSVCQSTGHECDKTSPLRSGITCRSVQDPDKAINASLKEINTCFEELKGFKCFFENLSGSATRISLSTFLHQTGSPRLRERLEEVIDEKLPRVYSLIFGTPDDSKSFLGEYATKISEIVSGCHCSTIDVFSSTTSCGDSTSFSSSLDEPSEFQILENEDDIRNFIATGLREWNDIISALWKKLQCRDPNTDKQYLNCSTEPEIC